MALWHSIRRDLRSAPVVEGDIAGITPLHAERFLLQGVDRSVRGYDVLGLVAFVGGSRVREGELDSWRTHNLPAQMLLVPPNCPTHWYFSGPTDFGLFLFTEPNRGMTERLTLLTSSARDPVQFSDPLVGATVSQIFHELQKGSSRDDRFVEKLADVMLEQVYRVLTTPETGGLSPRHIHFSRLQKVLPYIRRHLADDLSVQSLSDLVGLSSTHFRRLFHETLGVPVHRYIQAARLEQARLLLGTTNIPISKIAEESGFSSQSHMTACFRAAHAATPAAYRRQVYRAGAPLDRK